MGQVTSSIASPPRHRICTSTVSAVREWSLMISSNSEPCGEQLGQEGSLMHERMAFPVKLHPWSIVGTDALWFLKARFSSTTKRQYPPSAFADRVIAKIIPVVLLLSSGSPSVCNLYSDDSMATPVGSQIGSGDQSLVPGQPSKGTNGSGPSSSSAGVAYPPRVGCPESVGEDGTKDANSDFPCGDSFITLSASHRRSQQHQRSEEDFKLILK